MTTKKLAKPIILTLGLAFMLCCLAGCVGIGNTYANADKYSSGDLDYDGEITALDINWSSGSVSVSHHDIFFNAPLFQFVPFDLTGHQGMPDICHHLV